ncbi:MAG: hypothetical protein R3F29_13765 [Planctomycetota bacterium]
MSKPNIRSHARAAVRGALTLACSGAAAVAQCDPTWLPGDGVPGANGDVLATLAWDPDGPGPAGEVIVVGGDFTMAGDLSADRIATYEPTSGTWQALGGGADNLVRAFVEMPNGDLVAAGAFTHIGGVAAGYVARWDGTTWSPLGAGLGGALPGFANGVAMAMLVLPNGDLLVGGQFTLAGGAPAQCLARWDGSSWSQFGGVNGAVTSLVLLPNGDLVVGGSFTSIGGIAAANIARWDGSSWSPLGTGTLPWITSMLVDTNGDLIVGGTFDEAGGVPAIAVARWDGAAWSMIGGGIDGDVASMTITSNGDLIVGGFVYVFGSGYHGAARWDGATWSPIPNSQTRVYAMTPLANGGFVAGGTFVATTFSFHGLPHLAVYGPGGWGAAAAGFDIPVGNLAALPGGDVIATGGFLHAGDDWANRVARWDGSSWSPLGDGVDSTAWCAAGLPNGDVVVGGAFQSASGVTARGLARWDGTNWSAMTTTNAAPVSALHLRPDGDLIAAGGMFAPGVTGLARWDGVTWSSLGEVGGGQIAKITTAANGDLFVTGTLTTIAGVTCNGVARWDGTSWHALGGGLSGPITSPAFGNAVIALPDGDVVVGGFFQSAGGVAATNIARWNGTTWSPIGGGSSFTVTGLAALPDGDFVAAGYFGANSARLARWDGSTWNDLGAGLGGAQNYISQLLWHDDELLLSGSFLTIGGVTSAYFARLAAPCPATTVSQGTPCVGSGGANVLTAATQPWTGGTMRAVATGMPALGISLAEIGFGTVSIPLPAILPVGVPGCDWLTTPDLLMVAVPSGGEVTFEFAIPGNPVFAGYQLYEQVLTFELDAQLAITSLTSTNQLQLTIGTF